MTHEKRLPHGAGILIASALALALWAAIGAGFYTAGVKAGEAQCEEMKR